MILSNIPRCFSSSRLSSHSLVASLSRSASATWNQNSDEILSFYLDKFQNFLKKKYIIIANILPSPKDWFLSWWLVFITDLDLVLLFPLIRWNDVRALRFLLLIPCCQFGALRFRSFSGSLCRMTPMLGPLLGWFLLRLRLLRRFHTQNWFPAH